jgi:hypothetical protein
MYYIGTTSYLDLIVFLGVMKACTPDSAVLLGMLRRQLLFSPLEDLKANTDFE